MRNYGKVSPQFWIGETGKALRGHPEAQIVAVYLMTCPHATMTGVFHCPVLYVAHETGLGMEGASKGLRRLIDRGFCEYEDASESVFVVRMAAYQIGDTLKLADKQVTGLRSELQKMPKGVLKQRFIEVYGTAYHLVETAEAGSPLDGACKPQRSQEQEQEHEREPEKERPSRKRPPAKSELPAEFGITPAVRSWANMGGFDRLDERLAHFVGWAKASGKQYADWDQAFQNAIRDDWAKLTGTYGPGDRQLPRAPATVFKTAEELGL